MFLGRSLTQDELTATTIKRVTLHVGERWISVQLGVIEMGYTLNRDLTLQKSDFNAARINVANIIVARVNDEFYQVLQEGTSLHLYLPSVVDADDKPWISS